MGIAYEWFIYIGALLGLFLIFFKRLQPELRPVVYLLIITALEEVISNYCTARFHYNLPVKLYYDPIEFSCVAWFIYNLISSNTSKRIIWLLVIAMYLFTIYCNFRFWRGDIITQVHWSTLINVVKSMLMLPMCGLYIADAFKRISKHQQLNTWILYIVGTMLFYYALEALFKLIDNYLISYAIEQHISVYEIYNEDNVKKFHVCEQLFRLQPLFYFVNDLLYFTMILAFLKNLFTPKVKVLAA